MRNRMSKERRSRIVHGLFRGSIFIKGIDGALEVIGGILLLTVDSQTIARLVTAVFREELLEDPTDLIARSLTGAAKNLSISALSFAALYLIIHGVIKVGLVAGLWSGIRWAYPLAGIVLSLLIIYQLVRLVRLPSLVLSVLTTIDLFILVLLRTEYRRLLAAG